MKLGPPSTPLGRSASPPRAGADPDGELLAALRRGDDAAYERVVREHGPRLLAVARRMLRDEQEAQDALQEAFLSAFKAIGRFEGQARLSTWLHRIVVNASLMRLRSRRRRPEEAIDPLLPVFDRDGHHAADPSPWPENADELLARQEVREQVRSQIDALPEPHRSVLLLRDIEELDTGEVAELLGVSPGAVKTRLHRARLALRGLLDRALREDGA